jgi:hypothetical protein
LFYHQWWRLVLHLGESLGLHWPLNNLTSGYLTSLNHHDKQKLGACPYFLPVLCWVFAYRLNLERSSGSKLKPYIFTPKVVLWPIVTMKSHLIMKIIICQPQEWEYEIFYDFSFCLFVCFSSLHSWCLHSCFNSQ